MSIAIKTIERKGVLQHDSSDCGAACLSTIVRCLGGNTSIEELRKISGTTQIGTTLLGLYQAAVKCGFDATGYEAGLEDIKSYRNYLILHVSLENGMDHYIVSFGYEDEKFILWDPGFGLRRMTSEELGIIWKSKKCLGLIRNTEFNDINSQRNTALIWLKQKIRPDLAILGSSLFIGIAISVLSMVMAVFTQKLIDKIIPSRDYKGLSLAIGLLLFLLIVKTILGYIRQLILLFQGRTFNLRIINDFFGLIINLPKSFYDTRKKGDFIGRLNDTMRIQKVISEFVSVYLIDILVLVASLSFLFYYSYLSALITLLFFPILFLSIFKWSNRVILSQREVMAMYAGTESNYIDSLSGITEIKSLSWQSHFLKRNNEVFGSFQDKIVSLGRIKLCLGLIAGCIGILYLIIVLSFSSFNVLYDKMTTGKMMAILSISSGILPSLLNISLIAIPISEAKVALSRMFEFTMSRPEGDNVSKEGAVKSFHSLQLKDICFRFPGRSLLLDRINLEIRKGEVVTLFGETGGGKSTIAGIIMRFYEKESGEITVNEFVNSVSIQLSTWRSRIIIIPQDVHIFNGTILQNILPEPTEEDIKSLVTVIEELGLVRFFESFPANLLTQVGEDGHTLSGGQKQVIAFVRAVLKKPDFLIIDEGTSNLDSNSEAILADGIRKMKENSGILLISHKQELIKTMSDVSYKLEKGILRRISINGYEK
ncbi:MAG TPA: ABC transporter transmembrane domain-containing protein [Bacteroidales bacterium]|nr:ABC transporter transmembrane domain-containing protein [Bacteroidales bacterium]